MKAKKILRNACIFSVVLLVSTSTFAQQQKQALPSNPSQKAMPANSGENSYSFKLYNAPNNAYGYDIYKDGKPVYHQFVLVFISKEGKRFIATKPQTKKAALLAIEKIKKGQSPLLSGEELKKIVAL
ncbi:hypothetical protein FC093_08375 [Ilyomonas limi]|uniref:DUF4907 domain-containing protein n=1 Tax=Ilyomonas limi TaxID=2575867 RepID=A0A4U3L2E1_9BACT|nr:DUF4907 domain-containing protein [Ilyomonas limi]TKK69321.1 hypothetical protein FC093_08375 [Ilyomonas limi]